MKRLALVRAGWYRLQLEPICAVFATAAPADEPVRHWHSTLPQTPGARRNLKIPRFCIRGRRRRLRYDLVVIFATALGWI